MNIQVQAKQYTNAAEMREAANALRKQVYRQQPPPRAENPLKAALDATSARLAAAERLNREMENDYENALAKIAELERLLDFVRGEVNRIAGDTPRQNHDAALFKIRPTIRDICLDVLRDFPGVTFLDITGERGDAYVVEGRYACIYEIKKRRPDISMSAIGRAFNRDHTTILYALKKMKRLEEARAREAAK